MRTFLIWWLFTLVLGIGFMPLAAVLFKGYKDKGWIFAKVLGLAISGYLTWLLVCRNVLPFTAFTCMIVTLTCIALNFALLKYQTKHGKEIITFSKEYFQTIIIEEVLFFVIFMAWTYFAGFRPEAYGTEKFMDYGFMAAMMRSETLPAQDLWYSGEPINYYYGGQYYAVFMTKLTGTRVTETYNVMRTMIAAYAFVIPFAVVSQLWDDVRLRVRNAVTKVEEGLDPSAKKTSIMAKIGNVLVGLLAGAAVSLAGNMHYVIIGKLWPWAQRVGLVAASESSYWFPNSTRFIGFHPEGNDQTIHEFPSYSFILGDLHAHVVNVMYVLVVMAILYAWIKTAKRDKDRDADFDFKEALLSPYILIFGFFIGIFQWTNYWDFMIYMVVIAAVAVYRMILLNGDKLKTIIAGALSQMLAICGIGFVVALPFTLLFKTMTVEGKSLIGAAFNHSIWWQWLILWGLPLVITTVFVVAIINRYLKTRKARLAKEGKEYKYNIFEHIAKQDTFIIILGLCATGLILIPEVVFVRDIYEGAAARANTMFKLTYQAFIMFGMVMTYIIARFIAARQKIVKTVGIVALVFLLATVGYIGNAVNGWAGDITETHRYKGLDATNFLEVDFPEDAAAIRWLQANIKGSPVVLEANGDSYSDYCRVSAMTGLPTIVGWYVHQWLWRSETTILNERIADIESIYTSENWDIIESLIKEYKVEYIFVGKQEREKFENLNHAIIRALGTVVFEEGSTYIIKVGVEQ